MIQRGFVASRDKGASLLDKGAARRRTIRIFSTKQLKLFLNGIEVFSSIEQRSWVTTL